MTRTDVEKNSVNNTDRLTRRETQTHTQVLRGRRQRLTETRTKGERDGVRHIETHRERRSLNDKQKKQKREKSQREN